MCYSDTIFDTDAIVVYLHRFFEDRGHSLIGMQDNRAKELVHNAIRANQKQPSNFMKDNQEKLIKDALRNRKKYAGNRTGKV